MRLQHEREPETKAVQPAQTDNREVQDLIMRTEDDTVRFEASAAVSSATAPTAPPVDEPLVIQEQVMIVVAAGAGPEAGPPQVFLDTDTDDAGAAEDVEMQDEVVPAVGLLEEFLLRNQGNGKDAGTNIMRLVEKMYSESGSGSDSDNRDGDGGSSEEEENNWCAGAAGEAPAEVTATSTIAPVRALVISDMWCFLFSFDNQHNKYQTFGIN